jgi:hypothetical protein
VSKLPSFAVAECAVGPLLVQVTVSPAWTVIVAGPNEKSLIVTAPVAAVVAAPDLVAVADRVVTAVAARPAVAAGLAIPDLTARGVSDLARSWAGAISPARTTHALTTSLARGTVTRVIRTGPGSGFFLARDSFG